MAVFLWVGLVTLIKFFQLHQSGECKRRLSTQAIFARDVEVTVFAGSLSFLNGKSVS